MALTAWLCCCEEVQTWHGNSAQGITDKHPDLNLVVSHWHSLPHGTGTFPAACRERTPHLYAAKPCFPCPTLCISMKKVKLEERRTLAEDEVQHLKLCTCRAQLSKSQLEPRCRMFGLIPTNPLQVKDAIDQTKTL